MSNMGSGTTYRKGAGETTEWDDILKAKGIIGPTEEEIQREAMEQAERMAEDAKVRIDPLEHKTVAELDELEEDDAGYGDSRLLDAYRQKRLAEMKALAAKNKFGDIYPLVRADFVREVTDASKEVWVIVFLYQDHVMDSKLLARVLPSVARKHRAAKFMSIRADACIENYPDRNVPTLLLYHDGACQTQIIGLGELGGPKVDEKIVEWVLSRKGAVTTDLEDDPRDEGKAKASARGFTKRFGAAADSDDED